MKLKLMLVKYDISQKELAKAIGVCRQTVTNRINNLRGEWTESEMLKVWEYFKTHVNKDIKITDLFF